MPVWLIQIIVGIVLSAASTLAQQAFGGKSSSQSPKPSGFRDTVQTGGKNPQSFVIGTHGLPGKLEYDNTWGTTGDTPNAYRTQVISLGDLPITALTGLYESSQAMTLTTSGHVSQGYPVAERASSGADYFWEEFHDGSQTTANAFLTTTFGSDADRPWTSSMIGRGIPYVTLTALYNESVWLQAPQCMFQVQGIRLYDPRKDSTAGGSGSQRLNNQSTWAFSDNAIVAIYNILVGIRYEDAIIWGGSVVQSQLPYENWAAAMNAADAAITLNAGGTEPAFRIGREIQLSERPADVIQEFLVASNARIGEAAGVYSILVGAPGAADGTFTDADVIITESTQLDPFPNLDETVNGATATYLEPAQAWESKDTAPYYRSDLEVTDRGRRQAQGLTLNAVFSGTQAQRILKATVEEARRFAKHVVPLVPVFGTYRPLQALGWTSSQNGYSSKLFLISSWIEATNGNVTLGLQEIDPSDHTWSPGTDEKPLSFAPLTPVVPAAQAIKGWSVEPAEVLNSDDEAIAPAIKVNFDGSQADVDSIHVKVRLASSGAVIFSTDIRYGTPTPGTKSEILSSPAFAGDTAYQVQGYYVTFSGRAVLPSDWLDVTTPDVATGVNNVQMSQLSVALQSTLNWIKARTQDVADAVDGLSSVVQDQDLANFDDKQTLRRELQVAGASYVERIAVASTAVDALSQVVTALTATVGQAQASIANEITARANGDGALTTAVQSLRAALGGNDAEVNVVIEAQAAPTGYSARYAIRAAVNDGQLRQGTMFIDVPADPDDPVRIGFEADQTVFFASDGTPLALIDGSGVLQSANGKIYLNLITGVVQFTS